MGGQGRGARGSRGECTERWCCATPTASASAAAAAEPSSASKQHAKVCTEHSALTHSLLLPTFPTTTALLHTCSPVSDPLSTQPYRPSPQFAQSGETWIQLSVTALSARVLVHYLSTVLVPPLLSPSSHPPLAPSLPHSSPSLTYLTSSPSLPFPPAFLRLPCRCSPWEEHI